MPLNPTAAVAAATARAHARAHTHRHRRLPSAAFVVMGPDYNAADAAVLFVALFVVIGYTEVLIRKAVRPARGDKVG